MSQVSRQEQPLLIPRSAAAAWRASVTAYDKLAFVKWGSRRGSLSLGSVGAPVIRRVSTSGKRGGCCSRCLAPLPEVASFLFSPSYRGGQRCRAHGEGGGGRKRGQGERRPRHFRQRLNGRTRWSAVKVDCRHGQDANKRARLVESGR